MRVAGPAVDPGRWRTLFAGIDTHKGTPAVAVVDQLGRQLASEQLPNTEPGFLELVELLEAHSVGRVGIEGLGNFGRAIARSTGLSNTRDSSAKHSRRFARTS